MSNYDGRPETPMNPIETLRFRHSDIELATGTKSNPWRQRAELAQILSKLSQLVDHLCAQPAAPEPEQSAGVNAIGDFYDVPAAPASWDCIECAWRNPVRLNACQQCSSVKHPAAPEPSELQKRLDATNAMRERAESAETQLAAVVDLVCADGKGLYAKQVAALLSKMRAKSGAGEKT